MLLYAFDSSDKGDSGAPLYLVDILDNRTFKLKVKSIGMLVGGDPKGNVSVGIPGSQIHEWITEQLGDFSYLNE